MINVMLLGATIVMLISSIAISRDMFAFLHINAHNYNAWRTVHIVCAVVILNCVFLHVLLHIPMFEGLIRKRSSSDGVRYVSRVVNGVLAVVFAVRVPLWK
ncbi:MAG: DUF4405 domain-containing protein [Lachnospiraceae bacterium]|nr:DUF4405 domain-containing protein [Lachnospiraceae bacterium]